MNETIIDCIAAIMMGGLLIAIGQFVLNDAKKNFEEDKKFLKNNPDN